MRYCLPAYLLKNLGCEGFIMTKLNILVAEDDEKWQSLPNETLENLSHEVTVEIAPDYASALRHIRNQKYDLATVDLSLSGAPFVSSDTDLLGMELMREWRASNQNQACGLIVLTAYSKNARIRDALLKYGAFDFIDKVDFDNHKFPDLAREAILDARLKYAIKRKQNLFHLTISYNEEYIIGCKIMGPDRTKEYTARHPKRFETSDLIRRADTLNLFTLINGDAGAWRPEAKSIGNDVYKTLSDDPRIMQDIKTAQALAGQTKDLWVEFSGPARGLGIPFELLRDEDDSFCLKHNLTRRLVQDGFISRKTESFPELIRRLQISHEIFRLLIVGSNSDGSIPGAEEEARMLVVNIEKDLQTLGITHQITSLIGKDATLENVKDSLRSGSYHIFHYAGHGRFDDNLPEISGIILLDEGKPITVSASDLNLWVKDSNLQFVFLSCCLGARSAQQVGRGDFFGTLDALARADIPGVLGYRWTVADTPALNLAKSFYESLWRTFLPAGSLLEARNNIASGKSGRDDETWLSPVLLVQNR